MLRHSKHTFQFSAPSFVVVCVREICCVDVMSPVRARSLERVNAFGPLTNPVLISKSGFWRHLKNENRIAYAILSLGEIIFFFVGYFIFLFFIFRCCRLANNHSKFKYCRLAYILIRNSNN